MFLECFECVPAVTSADSPFPRTAEWLLTHEETTVCSFIHLLGDVGDFYTAALSNKLPISVPLGDFDNI